MGVAFLGESFIYVQGLKIDMKVILIKPNEKSLAEILIDKLMFKSNSEVLKAFDGMTPTEYFRKLRDFRARQKTF